MVNTRVRALSLTLCVSISLAIGVAGLSGPSTAAQALPAPSRPIVTPRPRTQAGHVGGDAAIRRLGARLPAVAALGGWQADELTGVLHADAHAQVDGADVAFYAEATATAGPTDSSFSAVPSGLSAAEVFSRQSLPGAPLTIYLDVDGAITTGTQWNSSFGQPTITSAAFDLDGASSTWSDSELRAIETIWRSVSEDFAPFQVNVTTQDPGVEALRRSAANDTAYGVRVVITPTNWYSAGAGGVAYIGSFSWGSDTPAYVFTQQLANSAKYIAEAASHETGHTVGLAHDGQGSNAYYYGTGGWAPIMGAGYYQPLVQWSQGEYSGATTTQDDLAIIQSYLPSRPDDAADTAAGAPAIALPGAATGLIGGRSDTDVYRLDAPAGVLTATAAPVSVSPDADLSMTLLAADGVTVLSASDPLGAVAPSLSYGVPAATTLYLRVDGVGAGDPTGSTGGYSDYASLGAFRLSVASSGAVSTSTTPTTPTTTTPAPTTTTTTPATTTTTPAPTTTTTTSTSTTPPPTTTTPTTTTPTATARISVVSVRAGGAPGTVTADVVIVDQSGRPISGATVTGTWSGMAKGSSTATTASDGHATTPDVALRKSGQVSFTVTSVRLRAGVVWDGVQRSASAKV